MNLTTTQKLTRLPEKILSSLRTRTDAVYMLIIIAALAAFEIFNFSTTDFALRDMLGDQGIGAFGWSTILSLAFCGMDFAGIARLLAARPDDSVNERDGWYLMGAWVLAAAMNAGLTWWGVSVAVFNHPVENALIIDPMTFVRAVPVVVAVMVWVIRILIIGSLVSSLNRSLDGHNPVRARAEKGVFGFKPSNINIPAGYRPIPDASRAQNPYDSR